MRAVVPASSLAELKQSLQGAQVVAFLTAEPRASSTRWSDVVFHPARPWLAAIDPVGAGIIWNYETSEVVTEFSLQISREMSAEEATSEVEAFAAEVVDGARAAKAPPSPTASFVKSSRLRSSQLRMTFFDEDAIAWTTKQHCKCMLYEEAMVVVTSAHVVFCDLNQPTAIRVLPSEDLHRQAPCSLQILPTGLLAIGCQDGKIRVWDSCQWRALGTLDSGSSKEVQQLELVAVQSSREAGAWSYFLLSATADGHISTWRVSANGECVRVPGDLDLREQYKAFESGVGISELKFHAHQDMITVCTRDGGAFIIDAAPLLRQSRSLTLVGVVPSTRLAEVMLLAGTRKAAFTMVSLSTVVNGVSMAELGNKGRVIAKDGTVTSYNEYAPTSSCESRDVRVWAKQPTVKKVKTLALCGSAHDPTLFCCATSLGVGVLKLLLPHSRAVLLPRITAVPPLVAHPGSMRVAFRAVNADLPVKHEDYKLQPGSEGPSEKLKTPVMHACPTDPSLLAVTLPGSARTEVLRIGVNQKDSTALEVKAVYTGTAIGFAWHSTKPRFALLIADTTAHRRSRAASSAVTTRRHGFKKHTSTHSSADDGASSSDRAPAMRIMLHEITADGQVIAAKEACTCGDDRILHLFSGPLLGVVKFELAEEAAASVTTSTASFYGADENASTPTARASMLSDAPPLSGSSNSNTASQGVNASNVSLFSGLRVGAIKKMTLEFFDWETGSTGGLKRVGPAIECPRLLEWERTTQTFCALAYPTCIKICRVVQQPHAELTWLHVIPTHQPALSLLWMHHMLFYTTERDVYCCVASKARVFTFHLASQFEYPTTKATLATEIPSPQPLATGANMLIGIHEQRLLLAAPAHALHTVDLSNKVLQCCMWIALGEPDRAIPIAETLDGALHDWLASVFEAFAFPSHALRLSHTTLTLQCNLAIKHAMVDTLIALVAKANAFPDSPDATGRSLFQRVCACLAKHSQTELLTKLYQDIVQQAHPQSHRIYDALFLATLTNNDQWRAQTLTLQHAYAGAWLASKRQGNNATPELHQWNAALDAPIAPWKTWARSQAGSTRDQLHGQVEGQLWIPAIIGGSAHSQHSDVPALMTMSMEMTAPQRLCMLFGSQTGCAESIAKRLYDDACARQLDATLQSLNEFQRANPWKAASREPLHVVIVCSTTGNGDPPDNAEKFWRVLKRRSQPSDLLSHVTYTVLGLGDTNYDKFCFMGKGIDKRMQELGATRFFELGTADEAMGLEDTVEAWIEGLWRAVDALRGGSSIDVDVEDVNENGHGETMAALDSDQSAHDHAIEAERNTAAVKTTRPLHLPAGIRAFDELFPGPTPTPPESTRRPPSALYTVETLNGSEPPSELARSLAPEEEEQFSATCPFDATIMQAKYLTATSSERKVVYIELSVEGAKMQPYKPGDSIGIKCPNRREDVEALIMRLGLNGDTYVRIESTADGRKSARTSGRYPPVCRIHDLFMHYADIRSIPSKTTLRALAPYCEDQGERARLLFLSSKSGAEQFKGFITEQGLTLLELLLLFDSCHPPLEHVLTIVPQLMPRYYSIATSPLQSADRIGIAYSVVDELVGPNGIHRLGLCTNWLHTICKPLLESTLVSDEKIRVPVFLRPSEDFHLPKDATAPIILVGPGTGVAPFMGFLQHEHLQAMNARDQVAIEDADLPATERDIFLFFGCRRKDEDWIFEDEMKGYLINGTLRRLFVAYSRDQDEKHYVQHELCKHGEVVARVLLGSHGYVFVCGDGTQMAKDVHKALCSVLEQHAHLSAAAAEEHLALLAAHRRYVRDIW